MRRFSLRGIVTTLAVAALIGAVQGIANLNAQHYAKGTPLEAILDLLRPATIWLKETTTDPRFLLVAALLIGGTLSLWGDFVFRGWVAWRQDSSRGYSKKIDRRLLAMTAVLIFGAGFTISVIWLAIETRMRPVSGMIVRTPASQASVATPPSQTVVQPSPPPPSQPKTFTDRTPGEILALFEGRTMFQANQLIEPLKGLWIKAQGAILQIIPNGPPGASTIVLKDGDKLISCNIDAEWSRRVMKLNTDDIIKVEGKIQPFQNGQQLYLLNCELVD